MRLSQYKALENKVAKSQFFKTPDSVLIPVPDNWYDFACQCEIRSGAGIQKFVPYLYQIKAINQIEKSFLSLWIKGRQLGASETIANWMLWRALRLPGFVGLVLSVNQQSSSLIAARLRKTIDSIPQYAKLVTDSLLSLSFSNGSQIFFKPSSPASTRGIPSVHVILLDEAAFIPDVEQVYGAALATTTTLGDKARIIAVSTPDMESGWYYERLTQNNADIDIKEVCELMSSGKVPGCMTFTDEKGNGKIITHWRSHPKFGAQDDYLEKIAERTQADHDTVRREYDLCFTASGTQVFSSELVRESCTGTLPRARSEEFEYYFGIDVSTIGDDYTVCAVGAWDGNKLILIDYFRARKQSSEYYMFKIGDLIKKYQPTKVVVEKNGIGQMFLEQLSRNHSDTYFEGYITSQASKESGISLLKYAMESKKVALPEDKTLIEEFLSFTQKGKKFEAISGKHDDFIMSLVFLCSGTPIRMNDNTIEYYVS